GQRDLRGERQEGPRAAPQETAPAGHGFTDQKAGEAEYQDEGHGLAEGEDRGQEGRGEGSREQRPREAAPQPLEDQGERREEGEREQQGHEERGREERGRAGPGSQDAAEPWLGGRPRPRSARPGVR